MHDKNGEPLAEGDTVTITCVITTCYSCPEYCNVTVKTVEPMPPTDQGTMITLNTKQVEKIGLATDTEDHE